ncbi:hypothetical protein HRbin03_00405 [archaeon HR03]|nr:hypothetical protein HRbin03_00405 [archaeon HR03]
MPLYPPILESCYGFELLRPHDRAHACSPCRGLSPVPHVGVSDEVLARLTYHEALSLLALNLPDFLLCIQSVKPPYIVGIFHLDTALGEKNTDRLLRSTSHHHAVESRPPHRNREMPADVAVADSPRQRRLCRDICPRGAQTRCTREQACSNYQHVLGAERVYPRCQQPVEQIHVQTSAAQKHSPQFR